MSVDDWVEVGVWVGAIPATLFFLTYPFLSPGWRRTLIGWALLVSSGALALLLDLSLAAKVLGPEWFLHHPEARISIVWTVAAGACLKLTALWTGKARLLLAARRRRIAAQQ